MRVNIGMPVVRTDGQSVGHVITKFSGMGRFIYPWCSAGALRARSSAINNFARENILRLKIGTIDTITKITNLVSVIKEQKYYFEWERILLYNVQVISLLVHFQMNH